MEWSAEIEKWLLASGTNEGRLGMLSAANPKAVDRIRDGTAQVQTLAAVLSYIRTNPVPKKGHSK